MRVKILLIIIFFTLSNFIIYGQSTIFVNTSASGNNNGLSWSEAYTSLQSALDAALSGDEIWVAKGTYYPSQEEDGTTDTQRKYTFKMVEGVSIYGGFGGTESAVSERTDYSYGGVNETILSGDFNNDDVITGEGATLSITGNSENAYHIMYHPTGYTLSNALLDGFTLKGGNASGTSNPYNDGGAIYNEGGQTPTINNCYFIGNKVSDNGGAIQTTDAASNIIITNCYFTQNYASDGGGAITNLRSTALITNCLFWGNRAVSEYGGAIINWDHSNTVITNCTIVENSAVSGGGIHNTDVSDVTITNSIIYGNTITTGKGPQVRNYNNSDVTISYSDIEGGIGVGVTAGLGATTIDGGGNIDANPVFVTSTFNSSHPYSIQRTSPCVDLGDNTANSESYDIRGTDFVRKLNKTDGATGGTIDIGAYEYNFYEDLFDPNIIFVNDDASGNNAGINWKHAYTSFQTALESASSGRQIWVAKGIYKPSKETDGTTDSPNDFTFRMIEGVEIYGGFAGTETETSVRTNYGLGETNETILSGDLNGDDVVTGSGSTLSFSNNSDNTYNVFNHASYTLTNSAVLDGFTIKGGYISSSKGGGMYNAINSAPTIRNCVFTENLAQNGAAIYNTGNASIFDNCSFIKNKALSGSGGAILNDISPSTISNSIFIGNYAFSNGGGIYLYRSSGTIKNCLFYNNYGHSKAGAISLWNSSPEIVNVTITENSSRYGGGIYLQGDGYTPTLKNSIVWNNSASTSGNQIFNFAPLSFTITNCDIEGSNGSGGSWDSNIGVDGGNNIDRNPQFVGATQNPDQPYSIFGSSPCVDVGDNTANLEIYDIRGSGFDRKLNKADGTAGTIDIGAYEYEYGTDPEAPAILYVDASASGENSGFSWNDSFNSFQDALEIAASGGQIWVAKGTYKPSKEIDGTTDTPREFTFQMINGVEIYGGFAGTETSSSQRTDYGRGGANETILSGDKNGDDVVSGSGSTLSISNNTENCSNVFYHPNGTNLDATAVLDGFTITGGYADLPSYRSSGAGMLNYNSSPTINNCTFTGNATVSGSYGGAIRNVTSSPAISNCTFAYNSSRYGGALFNGNSSSPIITYSNFIGNYASFDGGGIKNDGSSPTIMGCYFSDNYAGQGGGINNQGLSEIINCLFINNSAGYYGGGVMINVASATVANCTFSGNSASSSGGGLFVVNSAQPQIKNTILWNNTASSGNEVALLNNGLPTFSYCDIEGSGGSSSWNSVLGTDGGNNIDSNPLFVGSGNDPFAITGVSPCADAGNDAANSETTDIRGGSFGRKLSKVDGTAGTIDIGAYEYQFGNDPLPVELTSFTANISVETILLTWQTATEVNNYGYEVERATVISNEERNLDWEKIGFVEGHGNSNSPKNYEFTDYELPNSGIVSYRLKQIDIDGDFEYSDVVEVNTNSELPNKYELLQNYPNPFNPSTTISFEIAKPGMVKLEIFNILGEKVSDLINQELIAGQHKINFNASELSSGTYFYRLTSGGKTLVRKMNLLK